jgi:hypothetical protein
MASTDALTDFFRNEVVLDRRLPDTVLADPHKWKFLIAEYETVRRFENVAALTDACNDTEVALLSIYPPVEYYQRHFNEHGGFKFSRKVLSPSAWKDRLLKKIGNGADSYVCRLDIYCCGGMSRRWLLYGDRDFELGFIAVSDEALARLPFGFEAWTADVIRQHFAHPWWRIEQATIDTLIKNYAPLA